MKVMIIEDEALFRASLKRKLSNRQGVQIVAEMENGIDAELALQQVDPDLILCDIRMPGMDGLTFLEQIHKDHGKRILFVFISGYSDFNYARQALRWGAFDYLTKPLDDAEFQACLDKVQVQLQLNDDQTLEADSSIQVDTTKTALQLSIRWVSDNLEEASLERAAEIANMHPVAFSRKFRSETGQTFIRFMTEMRMERAKQLLHNPLLKVNEIGRMVGYLDHRHFSETFKRHVGLKPSEYRDL